GLGLIPPINHQNDQCYLMYTNGTTSWVFITLPNGYKAKIEFFFGPEAIFLGGSVKIKITIEGLDGPIDELTSNFINGIYAGFNALFESNSLISINDLIAAVNNASSLTDYFDDFCKITGRDPKGSYWGEASVATTFMKHAIIGGYIASKMQKYNEANKRNDSAEGYRDFDRFDVIIGFWVSFWAERTGMKNPIYIDRKSIPLSDFNTKSSEVDQATIASLVDIANIVKAIAYTESGINDKNDSVNQYNIGGMMQVNISGWEFSNTSWGSGLNFISTKKKSDGKGGYIVENKDFLNAFNQIGIGVGILYTKLISHSDYLYSDGYRTPSIHDWLDAASYYYGNDPEDPADPSTPYRDYIKNILFYDKSLSKKWGDSNILSLT
ncbi:hypothetical protein LLG10_06895, partial [bacterium]|nr:hypothetical protein [bacterium]